MSVRLSNPMLTSDHRMQMQLRQGS